MATVETATQELHRLTSHSAEEFRAVRDTEVGWPPPVADPRVVDFVNDDLDRLPWFFKRYEPGLARLPLPRSAGRPARRPPVRRVTGR